MPEANDEPPTTPPPSATRVFGDRLELAVRYRDILADDGVRLGLIGPREVPRLWDRHVLNCAVIGEAIDSELSVTDVGSGAGLPGIPLAIARPDLSITLLEPLLRRSEFLSRVVDELGLAATVVRGRAEEAEVRATIGLADVVTSRAVAPLDRLAKWSAPLIRVGGQLVAIKGASAPQEIEEHRAVVGRTGLADLATRQCGVSLLEQPTTIIVGERRETGRPSRGAASRRRSGGGSGTASSGGSRRRGRASKDDGSESLQSKREG
ncbi:16S rRNA (guanine(527)-N(7))-methyltransferase RsmG [Gordonia soli]|nr:16S rRNA (guanine(527)-N(7))-methyltransferase RsmG [Gordonia soli]